MGFVEPSPFTRVAPRLVERGYSAIPIIPGSKAPGHIRHREWRPMTDWQRFADRLPSRFELEVWCTYPNAGIGVVCGGVASHHLAGIDIDTDDAGIAAAIIAAIPPTTIIKRGAKGSTRFYRGPALVRSKSWRLHGNVQVCDLIGPGRQTVLPPTVHMTTGKPYVWIAGEALEDVHANELPELMPGHIAAIDEALQPFGYREPEPLVERPATFMCSDQRGREYALGVLRGCAGDLARAPKGDRNSLMFFVVMRLGRCVARDWLSEAEAWAATWNACCANGYLVDGGERQFAATFASGMKKGLADPMPDPRERLVADSAFAERIKNLKATQK